MPGEMGSYECYFWQPLNDVWNEVSNIGYCAVDAMKSPQGAALALDVAGIAATGAAYYYGGSAAGAGVAQAAAGMSAGAAGSFVANNLIGVAAIGVAAQTRDPVGGGLAANGKALGYAALAVGTGGIAGSTISVTGGAVLAVSTSRDFNGVSANYQDCRGH
jgi:hypothetical protein